jgi:kynurenine 3-monooxygenase
MDIAAKAGVQIKFNSSLESIDFEKNTAKFKNGSSEGFGKMFGADGAGSNTRKSLNKKYRTESSITSLDVRYKELFMPALTGNTYAMEQTALHIWPRGEHMLMALPNRDGSFTMTVYMPTSWFSKLYTELDIQDYFKKYFSDALHLMPNCIQHFKERDAGFLGSLDTPVWTFDNTFCLVGDAAHAIVPFFGQGMNCGFSDVSFLLNQFDRDDFSWESCMESYQLHQKPAGDAIRDMSIENYAEMSSSVGDEKFLFRKKVERLIENKFPDQFRSRYAKVVYTDMPYHKAKEYGLLQEKILDKVVVGINDEREIDWELVESLVSKSNLI